jgi:Insulin-induced protein (INSIG)
MADSPHILRPIPRRAFEITPASTESSVPPSPPTEYLNPDLLVEKKIDMLSSPSRTRSILNLTSSTLFGIYSPTGHEGSREELSTPWGTGAQTPSQRLSLDSSPPQPSTLSWNTKTQRPYAPQRRPKPGSLQVIFRSLLLFAFGVAYGSIITQLHKSQNITPVRVPGVDSHSWYQHIAWGLSGVLLGNILPWVDLKWADEEDSVEQKIPPHQRKRSSRGSTGAGHRDMISLTSQSDNLGGDWYSAVRSIGAFVGIAFAVVSFIGYVIICC